ncbi:putative hydrolase of the HAD superfamily [Plasticicumulans lactativorans]|uniref:Putative hydrolase of the HAD superfamily n=1 Tax=Plasticicumulans lactativorans TaxID=1133106 RepID=A0A4R2LD51_9GAMM|nr:HAD family hydrolase [Plasticicumulans lactativorans]TCO82366.1 putative hydrolase of the HAD superfamily [Plasticicumulans lactativorans]
MPAIIFDLDNCLSAADAVGRELYQPAFEAIRAANDGSLSAEALDRAFVDAWTHPFDWVARRHGFTPAMFEAGWNAFAGLEVTRPMRGYADLPGLAAIPAERFLVTSGFRRFQQSKIRALGISALFTAIRIDAIDEPDRKGKRGLFLELIDTYRLPRKEVLVVGDNPESEIEAGNSLGLRTVQILRPGVSRGSNASHYIDGLAELLPLLAPRGS